MAVYNMINNREFTCLIPYTRRDKVPDAIKSANDDNWYVEILADSNQDGVHKIRETLLNRALASPDIKFIRYLDDDDILLPHREAIKEVFNKNPEIDIVYTNYIIKTPYATHYPKYSGNSLEDAILIHPWSWIAKADALRRVKNYCGYLWDYDRICREGGNTWLKFIEINLNIYHLDIKAYQYNKSFDPNCISNHPQFGIETQKLEERINKIKNLMK
jgi:hypothetical protein